MIRKVKRLLVISNMYPSEREPYFGVFVERQVEAIRSMGIECALAVSAKHAGGSSAAAAAKYLELSQQAFTEVGQFQPDAILAHYAFPTGAIALAARKRSRRHIPVALVAHGGDVDPQRSRPLFAGSGTRTVLRKVDMLIAVSNAIAREALHLGARSERIVVASMGYDDAIFRPAPRAASREKLGLSQDLRYAVLVGNLIPRKGIATLLTAAARASISAPELRWLVVGGGDIETWKAKAALAGVSEVVTFAGPALPADVATWLTAADVAVIPSFREPLGVAALEALACGIPVVASATGGLQELISHERNGLLVEPGDAGALTDAVARLLSDHALRIQLASAGHEGVREHTALRQARIMIDAIEAATTRVSRA